MADETPRDLPQTWPFRFAGVLVIVGLVWFCIGFALRDRRQPEGVTVTGPTSLPHHLPVFWGLILGALGMIVLGAVINLTQGRRRVGRRSDGH